MYNFSLFIEGGLLKWANTKMIEAKILHSESSTDSRFTNQKQKIRKDQEIQLQVKCFTKMGRKYSVDIGTSW